MHVYGTKDHGEREDEEAERLVRPLPKKKPPRRDKRRERMEVDRDPDLEDDSKRDPDLSLNYKSIGGSVSLTRIVRRAKETDTVKVRRKDDGKIVDVSKDTLRERGGEYEKYKSEDRWEEETQTLAQRVREDPALESRFKTLLDPKSDLGGLAKGNPNFPADTFEKNLPPNVKTLGDLLEVAEKALSQAKTKAKKGPDSKSKAKDKKPKDPGGSESEPKVEPGSESEPKVEPGTKPEGPKGLPPVSPAVLKVIQDLTKLSKPAEAPKAEEGVSESKPGKKAPKPEVSEPKPDGDSPEPPPPSPDGGGGDEGGKKDKKDKKKPTRRVPSKSELFEARQLVIDTFPPRMAGKFIGMHPDDIRELVSNFHDFKSIGPMKVDDLESELEKVKDWSLDPDKIEPPSTVTVQGKEVSLDSLSPEAQDEATQKHRMAVLGARVALRSRAIGALKENGAPSKLAGQITDFMLQSKGKNPDETLRMAKEKAKDVFATSGAEDAEGDEDDSDVDERFGTRPQVVKPESNSSAKTRASLVEKLKDPSAKVLAVAAFQGQDYKEALGKYLQGSGPDRISEKDSPSQIMSKMAEARRFFTQQSKHYPPDIVQGLEDPSTIFQVRVRHAISNMSASKAKALTEPFAEMEAETYDRKLSSYEKAVKRHEKLVAQWSEHKKGNPPVPPKEPQRPPQYSLVRPPKDEGGTSKVRDKLDKLLGGKQAAYSSYPTDRGQVERVSSSPKPETQRVSLVQVEGAMTIKFAAVDANIILTRLDKMAETIQKTYKKWGMTIDDARDLVNDLDRTADEIEKAAFGPESLSERQIQVLKEAKVIQQDSDEKYMVTFNAPMAPKQIDADESGYMSQFKDDQSQAVATGKSTTGRPLAP